MAVLAFRGTLSLANAMETADRVLRAKENAGSIIDDPAQILYRSLTP